MAPQRTCYIETLGCQMNKNDSELMAGLLAGEGFDFVDSPNHADLLILNTCQIRGQAEQKAYSYAGTWKHLKKKRPHVKIAMAGCVSQQTKADIFKRAPYIDIVFGTQNIQDLPGMVRDAFDGHTRILKTDRQKTRSSYDYFDDVRPRRTDSTLSAWLTIIEGCDYFCTYCVVPYTRGQANQPPARIDYHKRLANWSIPGFAKLPCSGKPWILTGAILAKTTRTTGTGLAPLLHALNDIDGLDRIRLMTSHPLDLNDDIIEAIATLPNVMEYIHIPMQAGDDTVLERMRRGYTTAQYYALMDKLHERIPGVAISGDYIVGFPGETDAQFQRSLESIARSGIDSANVAAYSARPQTPAGIWETRDTETAISDAVKQERLQQLNAAIGAQGLAINQKLLGQSFEVLIEGPSKRNPNRLTGRTRTNKVVNINVPDAAIDAPTPPNPSPLVGKLVTVRITEAFPFSLIGDLEPAFSD